MNRLATHFLRGLLVLVPLAVTIYVIWAVVVTLDRWLGTEQLLGRSVPGAGLVLTLALITVIGFLAGNIATRWLFGVVDQLLGRVPLIKLLYNALKDLIGAFLGEKKRFDKPVLVRLGDGVDTAVVGFLTRESLASIGLEDHVAVYFPQSYNFAGNLLVVPRHRITPIEADSTAVMAMIISGGVSDAGEKTNDPRDLAEGRKLR